MTRKTTEDMIEVMRAYIVDGKGVEFLSKVNGDVLGWVSSDTPAWNWDRFDYRTIPAPKEIWVNEYGNRRAPHATVDEAILHASEMCLRVAVRYIEAPVSEEE